MAFSTKPLSSSYSNILVCSSCKKPSTTDEKLKKCAKCHLVAYCNPTCQKNHWPEHKKVCYLGALLEIYKLPSNFGDPSSMFSEEYWADYGKENPVDLSFMQKELVKSGRLKAFDQLETKSV